MKNVIRFVSDGITGYAEQVGDAWLCAWSGLFFWIDADGTSNCTGPLKADVLSAIQSS